MNRKLRNTILAFSVTGTVLALGLMAARPVDPASMEHPAVAATAEPATDAAGIGENDGEETSLPGGDELHAHGPGARIEARSRQFEDELARAGSMESALALTAGFVAATAAEAVVAEVLAGEHPAAAAKAGSDPETAPRNRRGQVRRAVAVPYFSFARATGGSRS